MSARRLAGCGINPRPGPTKACSLVPVASLLGTQYPDVDLGGLVHQWFLGAASLLPSAVSGVDGSNTEERFHILWDLDSQWLPHILAKAPPGQVVLAAPF